MPLNIDIDKKGCFARWGEKGMKYYYTCEDNKEMKKAKKKALAQAYAMGYLSIEDIHNIPCECEVKLSNEEVKPKRTIITKMKEQKFELDVINKFGRIGRELPNDEEIIYEEELSEFSEELLSEEENNLLEVKFANEKINGLFVYYKYAVKKEVGPKVIPGTRDFCKTLINRNRVYTKDEIVNLGVNDLGTDLWKYRGGFWNKGEGNISPSCRHVWKRILTRKKI
jgi:hypothetical protein